MELKEWIQSYLKNRDAVEGDILSFEDKGSDFIVHKKSGPVLFLIRPDISDTAELNISGKFSLVVKNNRKNLDFVINRWDVFSKLQGLCIYFVNPRTNDKWLLNPYVHNQVTEKSALKRGLQSLFSMVSSYG